MKTKMRSLIFLFMLLLLLCIVSGCTSNPSKEIVGEWYNSKGKCLNIYSDGSWKLEDSYGTGTWKLLGDKDTFEFTDFYGDTQESVINKDNRGKYIDFGYYGAFYRDKYPLENDKEGGDNSEAKNSVIELNPFENLSFEVSGISPYCKVAINNSKCDDNVQKFVTYTFDKETYANGETANITAVLSTGTGADKYALATSALEYKVIGQPEYLTSVEGIDLTSLKAEVMDAVNAEKASISDSDSLFTMNAYDAGGTHIKSCDNIISGDVYFSSLKTNKNSKFVLGTVPYNRLSFTFAVEYTWIGYYVFDQVESGTGTMYLNVTAQNIVKYPDGTIKWGTSSTEGYDFVYCHSQKGMEDCISTTIMSGSADYNISKVAD